MAGRQFVALQYRPRFRHQSHGYTDYLFIGRSTHQWPGLGPPRTPTLVCPSAETTTANTKGPIHQPDSFLARTTGILLETGSFTRPDPALIQVGVQVRRAKPQSMSEGTFWYRCLRPDRLAGRQSSPMRKMAHGGTASMEAARHSRAPSCVQHPQLALLLLFPTGQKRWRRRLRPRDRTRTDISRIRTVQDIALSHATGQAGNRSWHKWNYCTVSPSVHTWTVRTRCSRIPVCRRRTPRVISGPSGRSHGRHDHLQQIYRPVSGPRRPSEASRSNVSNLVVPA